MVAGDHLREALGEPGAAGIDADERGVERDRAAHALGERGERLPRRQAGPRRSSAAVVEPGLQDQLRGDLVAHRLPLRPRDAGGRERAVGALRSCSARPRAPPAGRSGLRAAARSAGARGHLVRACRPRAPAGRPPARPAAIRRSARRSRRSARRSRSRVDRRQRMRDARQRVADRDADAPRAEIEREHRARRRSPVRAPRVTRARRRRTGARSRCRAAASPPAAAPRRACRTARPASAATVSQAFCAISCSSWPADQPA